MRDPAEVVNDIVGAVKEQGISQVPGYVRFVYRRQTPASVVLERRNGRDVAVPFSKLRTAIEAVREDHSVYISGPHCLRKYGITHINSPTWSLIRLLPLNRLID